MWANPRWCDRHSGRPVGGCGQGAGRKPRLLLWNQKPGAFPASCPGLCSCPSWALCSQRAVSRPMPQQVRFHSYTPQPQGTREPPAAVCAGYLSGLHWSCLEPRIWASPPGHSLPVSVSIREPQLSVGSPFHRDPPGRRPRTCTHRPVCPQLAPPPLSWHMKSKQKHHSLKHECWRQPLPRKAQS